jgi:hypothetical protein
MGTCGSSSVEQAAPVNAIGIRLAKVLDESQVVAATVLRFNFLLWSTQPSRSPWLRLTRDAIGICFVISGLPGRAR